PELSVGVRCTIVMTREPARGPALLSSCNYDCNYFFFFAAFFFVAVLRPAFFSAFFLAAILLSPEWSGTLRRSPDGPVRTTACALRPPPPLHAPRTQRGGVLTAKDVLFAAADVETQNFVTDERVGRCVF